MNKKIDDFNEDIVIAKKSVVLETETGVSINEVYILKDSSESLYYVIANAYGTSFDKYSKKDYVKFNNILPLNNIPVYLINPDEDEITFIDIKPENLLRRFPGQFHFRKLR